MKVAQRPLLVALTVLIAFLLCSVSQSYAQNTSIKKVVLDAGHGGKDPGAVSKTSKEKDINLSTVLLLGKMINENYPDVEVIYTRKTDVFIPLMDRANVANKANADLFISVHTNAAKSVAAMGTETLVMGADRGGKNLEVAMRENDVIMYEEDYSTRYQGYEPGSIESFIIFSLMQYAYLDQSMSLANMVQQEFTKNSKMTNRGVKPAGVLVLAYATMPAILTEFGFITNSTNEKFISSKEGIEAHARSIFNAFSAYKTKIDGKGSKITLQAGISGTTTETTANHDTATEQKDPTSETTTDIKQKEMSKVVFSVQLCTSTKKMGQHDSRFGSYKGKVFERKVGELYKYYTGEFTDYQQAVNAQAKARNEIKDAFVTAFCDGKPISANEARKMTAK